MAGIASYHWKQHGQVLQTGITDFFVHGWLTDTSVMHGSDISLQVHRLVMAVFLPSFKRSLVGDTPITTVLENPAMALNFDCVAERGEDVRALIEFMYTGTLTVAENRVKHMRQLAEDLCFQGLVDILSTDDHRRSFAHDQNGQAVIKTEVKNELTADDHSVGSKRTELPETIGVYSCDVVIKMEIPDDDRHLQDPVPEHAAHLTTTCISGTCNINLPPGGSWTKDKSTPSTVRCKYCDMELDNQMDLMIHVRCSHPSSTLPTIGRLKPKEKEVDGEEDYAAGVLRCKLCDIELANEMDLKIHFECSHPNTVLQSVVRKEEKLAAGRGLLRCESCDIQFDSQMDLKIHFRCSHPKDKIHECKGCGFLTLCEEELCGHVLSHHLTLTKKIATNSRFWCDKCDIGFDKRAALARHIQTNHSQRPAVVRPQPTFDCDQCPMMFKSAFTLKLHVRSKHGEMLHKCTVCDKNYSISYLAQHMARIHNIKLNTTLGERIGLVLRHRKRPSVGISSLQTVSKGTEGAINETYDETSSSSPS